MFRFRTRLLVPAIAVLVFLPALSAQCEEQVLTTVLGRDGYLHSLVQGPYGELFPGGSEAQAGTPILALRISRPDGYTSQEIVPATLDQNQEKAAELVVEPESGFYYVFWQSWTNLIQSRFEISYFDGSSWSETLEVASSEFAWRTSPSFAVTRDTFMDIAGNDGEQAALVHRTVLHILWSEQDQDDCWKTKYAPLILDDGEYIGHHPVLKLNDLIERPHGLQFVGGEPIAPVLKTGGPDNTVMATFFDQESGEIATVELRFAAGELSLLANQVQQRIEKVAQETDLSTSAGVVRLIAETHQVVEGFSSLLKPEILNPLSADLEEFLRNYLNGQGDVASIAGKARAQLVNFGFRLTDGKIKRIVADQRAQLVNFGVRSDGPRRNYDARSSVASHRRISAALEGPLTIVASSDGLRQILASKSAGQIRYQEVDPNGGWKPVQQITLTRDLGEAKAMALLQQRVER